MVVFAVDIGRRMMELRGTSLQCGRRTLLRQRCNRINGMARLTPRQGHSGVQMLNAIRRLSRCGSCIWIEELACSEHGMHDYRQFPRHSDGRPFEANPFPQLETPCTQTAAG